jgi:HEAT repeat protein
MIGGSGAAVAIARIIVDQVVDDPGLPLAVDAAVSLGARLPADMVAALLRHPAPRIRADACRCARGGKEVTELLVDLLNDLNPPVRRQAALALGRLGRDEARPALMRLLHAEPSSDVIEAIAAVADEDCQVLLGRVGCARHHLAAAAIAVLEDLDTPRATSIADMVRKSRAERAS